jgi:hypothetical protein
MGDDLPRSIVKSALVAAVGEGFREAALEL